jgi:hypothetical protein
MYFLFSGSSNVRALLLHRLQNGRTAIEISQIRGYAEVVALLQQ